MAYTFPYVKAGFYYRPIPIKLRHDSTLVEYRALIDSGADFNLFHGEIADILDIDLSRMRKQYIGGVGGSTIGYPYFLDICVNKAFHKAQVIFSYDIPLKGFGLLGQIGFFDHYIVEFNLTKKMVVLK